jgi:hypothetical protein
MSKVRINEDIYVRDSYNVRRRAFVKGDVVELYHYNAVLRTNKVVNPESVEVETPDVPTGHSLHSKPMEVKVLEDTSSEEVKEPVEEEVEDSTEDSDDEVEKPKKGRKSKKQDS